MRMKSCFEIVEVADEFLAIPIGDEVDAFCGIVALSEATAYLLNHMKKSKSKDDLIDILMNEYDVEYDVAKKDVEKNIKQLYDIGLIED